MEIARIEIDPNALPPHRAGVKDAAGRATGRGRTTVNLKCLEMLSRVAAHNNDDKSASVVMAVRCVWESTQNQFLVRPVDSRHPRAIQLKWREGTMQAALDLRSAFLEAGFTVPPGKALRMPASVQPDPDDPAKLHVVLEVNMKNLENIQTRQRPSS